LFYLKNCVYIYNTILFIISPLHQMTKKIAAVRVFLIQRLFFLFLKVVKMLLWCLSFAI